MNPVFFRIEITTMHDSAIDHPVFLVGSERSGSTLLRLMLDHHPDIALNLESEFMVTQIPDTTGYPDIQEYREWLRNDRVFIHSRFEINENLDFEELLKDFLRQKLERDHKKIVGAMVHFKFSRLLRVWPNAKFIYMYRDGRDVANSVVQMSWAGNPYVAADWWLAAEIEWEEVRSRLTSDRYFEIRYENLITNPHSELDRLCQFIGVEFSEHMFDYVNNSSYTMPDPKLNYQWKRKMSVRDLRLVEAKIGAQLLARGYELSGQSLRKVNFLADFLLHLESKIFAFKSRKNKFGLNLVVQEWVSRKLGILPWHRHINRAIDQIIDRTLR